LLNSTPWKVSLLRKWQHPNDELERSAKNAPRRGELKGL
jgi:hypothetical protein